MAALKDFKSYEVYSKLRVPPGTPFFVRCDGRGFRRVCQRLGLEKPFDRRLAELMVAAAREVVESGLRAALVYIFSDEANFLFVAPPPFGGRVEKLVSVVPSAMASRFSLEAVKRLGAEVAVSFDARVVPLGLEEVPDYLTWRQLDCFRNCLNSYAYYSLLKAGLSPTEASERLRGLKSRDLLAVVRELAGLELDDIPLWQRRGVLLRWRGVRRESLNPLTGASAEAVRWHLEEDWEPPVFSSAKGRRYLEEVLASFRAHR